MPLKTSLNSKPLFKNLSRHILFITIINIICTFLLMPFSYMLASLTGQSYDTVSSYLAGYPNGPLPLYFFGTMAYSVIAGVMLTYYLKSESASDFIHSLPVKRNTVLATTYFTFIAHLLFNLLLNSIALLCLTPLYSDLTIMKIVNWVLLSLIVALFIFTVTVVIGLLVNNVVSHLVFTIFILMLPGIINLIYFTLINLVYAGLDNFNDQYFLPFTVPLNVMTKISESQFDVVYFGIIFAVTLLLCIFSFFIYRSRRNENINEGYANKPAEYVLFTLLVATGTLLAGTIAVAIFPKNIFFLLVIFVIAFGALYYLMEMIAQKSVRITMHRKLLVTAFAFTVLALAGVLLAGKMQQDYVPDFKDVAGASLINQNVSYEESSNLFEGDVSDSAYIADVIASHRMLVGKEADVSNAYIAIEYHLKNGRTIKRGYEASEADVNKIKALMETDHNIDARIHNIDWEAFVKKNIRIERYDYDSAEALQLERRLNVKEKRMLANALAKDIVALKNDQDILSKAASDIAISDNDGPFLHVTVYHKNTIQVLQQMNIIKKVSDLFGNAPFVKVKSKLVDGKINEVDLTVLKTENVERSKVIAMLNNGQANVEGNVWYMYNSANAPVLFKVKE